MKPRREGETIDADYVRYRLEEAGKCLLSLPAGRIGPAQLSAQTYGFVSEVVEASGFVPRIKPAVPDAATITRMDEAYRWLSLIPNDKRVLRKIVAALSLISPVTERRVYSEAKVAKAIGCDRVAVQKWHEKGISLIVTGLKARREVDRRLPTAGALKPFKPARTIPQAPDAADLRRKAEALFDGGNNLTVS